MSGDPSRRRHLLSLSEGWFILGVTGSGKTLFAKRLVRALRELFGANLYVLDSKRRDDFEGWPGVEDREDAPPPLRVASGGVQVWRPHWDDPAAYDEWLDAIRMAGAPAIVLVDELASLARNRRADSFPVALAKLLKMGRSCEVCPIILSQEATHIDGTVKNQVGHAVYFRLQATDNVGIRQACALMGLPPPGKGQTPPEPKATYGLFYRRLLPAPGPLWEYGGLDEFFGDA